MLSITNTIIILTCIISFTAFNNEKIKNDLLFWPAEIEDRNQWYRFLTYGFVHGDLMHLGFNMISLYSLGEFVEKYLFSNSGLFGANGKFFYLAMYIIALILSTVPDYIHYRKVSAYRALGASGAVCAVIFSAIILQPKLPLSIFFLPAMPGYIFGVLFLALSVWLGKRGGDNIGHRAHFTGALIGIIFTIVAAKLFADYDVMKNFISTITGR